jgi:hypothetical protein
LDDFFRFHERTPLKRVDKQERFVNLNLLVYSRENSIYISLSRENFVARVSGLTIPYIWYIVRILLVIYWSNFVHNLPVFLASLVLVLSFPLRTFAQSVSNPNTGTFPPAPINNPLSPNTGGIPISNPSIAPPTFNGINTGIIGSFGGNYGSPCGTVLNAGASLARNGTPQYGYSGLEGSPSVSNGATPAFSLQGSVTHNLGNPCFSAEKQAREQIRMVCIQGRTQFLFSNPNMSIPDMLERMKVFDSFCPKGN